MFIFWPVNKFDTGNLPLRGILPVTSSARGRHNMLRPCKLTFDILTLKVVFGSRVTWATYVSILVFLGLSVLNLGPMYATDRRQMRIRLIPHRLLLQCRMPYGRLA